MYEIEQIRLFSNTAYRNDRDEFLFADSSTLLIYRGYETGVTANAHVWVHRSTYYVIYFVGFTMDRVRMINEKELQSNRKDSRVAPGDPWAQQYARARVRGKKN